MATDIRVPTLGESVSEATIGKWFKKPGDAVTADEPLEPRTAELYQLALGESAHFHFPQSQPRKLPRAKPLSRLQEQMPMPLKR